MLLEWFGAAEGYESSDFAQLCTKLKTNVFSPKRSNFTLALQTNISYRSSVTHNNFLPENCLHSFATGRCRSICWQRSFEDIRIAPMPSKMDCKEMRLTRFCRFWPPFAWFLAHFLCHVRGVATYDLFRESHPLTEPGHDLNGALGKELSTNEVGPC